MLRSTILFGCLLSAPAAEAQQIEPGTKPLANGPVPWPRINNLLAQGIDLESRDPAAAETLFIEALRLIESVQGIDESDVILVRSRLVAVVMGQGRLDDAQAIAAEHLARAARSATVGPSQRARLLVDLGRIASRRGHLVEAETAYRRALAELETLSRGRDREIAAVRSDLANNLVAQGRIADAVIQYGLVLDFYSGSELGQTARGLERRADLTAFIALVDPSRAEEELRRLLPLMVEVIGTDSIVTLSTRVKLGVVLAGQGRDEDAFLLINSTLEDLERVAGPDHVETLLAMTTMATAASRSDRHADAERLLRVVGLRWGQNRSRSPYNVALLDQALARAIFEQKREDEALPLIRRASPVFTERFVRQSSGNPDLRLDRGLFRMHVSAAWSVAGHPAVAGDPSEPPSITGRSPN